MMGTRLRRLIACATLAVAPHATAQDRLDDQVKVRDFNQIVALAQPCRYKLDKRKLQDFAENVVAKIDAKTRYFEVNAADLAKRDYELGSETERLALCSLYRGLSEHYGIAP